MSNLTIVMYHYVREIEGSAYPNIKGLEILSLDPLNKTMTWSKKMITKEMLEEKFVKERIP